MIKTNYKSRKRERLQIAQGGKMSAKEYLSQYRNLNTRVNAKCEQLARLRELSTKVSVGQGGGAPGCVSDRVGNIVAKICDAEREIRTT